jgi:hypothetical protein
VELLPLAHQPFLERRLTQVESIEEQAAIQSACRSHRLVPSVGDQPSEGGDIALHRVGDEPHPFRIEREYPPGAAERAPHPEEHLPEIVAGVVALGLAPQQRGQLGAGMGGNGREGEIREEGLGLPGQGEYPRPHSGLEAAEQRETHDGHGGHDRALRTAV